MLIGYPFTLTVCQEANSYGHPVQRIEPSNSEGGLAINRFPIQEFYPTYNNKFIKGIYTVK